MPTITRTKTGFFVQHTTREVWGVDDNDSPAPPAIAAHTPRAADQEASQQYRAKQRTRDRHQARNLKYSVSL